MSCYWPYDTHCEGLSHDVLTIRLESVATLRSACWNRVLSIDIIWKDLDIDAMK